MKKIFLAVIVIATSITASNAQKRCASQVINDRLNRSEAVKQARQKLEGQTKSFNQNARKAVQYKKATVKIPIVVHVLYRLESQNKTDADIQAQIDILNKDFNRLNTDANKTPTEFQGVAASVGIEFCLAAKDTNGNATTGIIRKQVTEKNIGNADTQLDKHAYSEKGGSNAWDVSKYVNIWVCEIDDAGTLGYAYFPGAAAGFGSPNIDGLVIAPFAFGTASVDAGTHLGRTTTHELGHYFNLHHIWADDQNEADQCAKDDLVDDTPKQAGPTQSICPANKFTCNSNDMYQNYMDYSSDDCMNIFTTGQKTRMLAALNNSRAGLLAGDKGCYTLPTGIETVSVQELAEVYPIPANTDITVNLKNNTTATVDLLDLTGNLVFATVSTTNGTANINVNHLASGTYLLVITSNGKVATTKVTVQ